MAPSNRDVNPLKRELSFSRSLPAKRMKLLQNETNVKIESGHLIKDEDSDDSDGDTAFADEDSDVASAHASVTTSAPLAEQQLFLPAQVSVPQPTPSPAVLATPTPARTTTNNEKSGADYVIKKLHASSDLKARIKGCCIENDRIDSDIKHLTGLAPGELEVQPSEEVD